MLIMKNFIPAATKTKMRQFLVDTFDGYATKSYSQEGEDMILRRVFEKAGKGFYVDVGAHHPKRFSNTYYFYKHGWQGLNIDARPGSMDDFKRLRHRDINIEAAIAGERKELTYYMFDEPALNTFDKDLAEARNGGGYRIINTKRMQTRRLDEVLALYLPAAQVIDFMSIDVEGLDLEVLQSNDWDLFRPRFILVENSKTDLQELHLDEIYRFLADKHYAVFAKTLKTIIYTNTERREPRGLAGNDSTKVKAA